MPRVISDMNISHICSLEQEQLQRLIQKEEYEEAMNNLPIYERVVIMNVIEKIRYEEYWGDCFNELEKRRDLMRMKEEMKKEAERKLVKNQAIGILFIGTLAYSCALLITR
jgi:hypothetical protein